MSMVGGQIQDWVSSRGACNSRLSRETTKSQVAFKVSKDGGPPPHWAAVFTHPMGWFFLTPCCNIPAPGISLGSRHAVWWSVCARAATASSGPSFDTIFSTNGKKNQNSSKHGKYDSVLNICTFLIAWAAPSIKNVHYLLHFLNNGQKSPQHFLIMYAHNSIFPICYACLRLVICYLLVPIDFLLPLLSFAMSAESKQHDLYQPSSTNH